METDGAAERRSRSAWAQHPWPADLTSKTGPDVTERNDTMGRTGSVDEHGLWTDNDRTEVTSGSSA